MAPRLPRVVPRVVPSVGRCVVGVVAVLLLTSGCLESGAKPAPAKPTPIGELQTGSMIIPRQAFCEQIPATAVQAAIKGIVDNAREWKNGEEGKTGDVGQEFGCEWKSADGLEARAWVYARPVTQKFAREVIAKTARRPLCTAQPPPKFGAPSQLQVCRLGGGVLRVRHAGLFGDTFLTCEVSEPTADRRQLRARAGTWCVDVATALDNNG